MIALTSTTVWPPAAQAELERKEDTAGICGRTQHGSDLPNIYA